MTEDKPLPIIVADPRHFLHANVLCKIHNLTIVLAVSKEWIPAPDPDDPTKQNSFCHAILGCGCKIKAWQRDEGI